MSQCGHLLAAKILTVILPIGIGPFMLEGTNSIIGWTQSILWVLLIIIPVITIVSSMNLNDDHTFFQKIKRFYVKRKLSKFMSSIISIILFVLYIVSIVFVFTKYTCGPNGLIIQQ